MRRCRAWRDDGSRASFAPRADVGDAILQFLFQHLGEEAARDVRRHQPFRVVSPLAEQQEIIGEPHRAYPPHAVSPSPLFEPQIDHVVQVDVGKDRTDPLVKC
jgi:hypothetical protein